MQKNKYFLFLAFFVLFLLLSSGFVHALEVKYPSIPLPGLTPPSASCTSNCLTQYVAYLFGLAIYIGGVLALISFTVGAVSLIISVDNAEASSNAKDRMKGSILGLVLIFAAFLIMKTINPILVMPILTPAPGGSGVFLVNGNQMVQAPTQETNTSALPTGFNTLRYICPDSGGPNLLVWVFPNPGLESGNSDLTTVHTSAIGCGGTIAIGGGSFKRAFETPGVYYYLDGGCTQYASYANTSSQNDIGDPFKGKMGGAKIVNDQNGARYGALFHGVTGLENAGPCGQPIENAGCQSPGTTPYAVDIFVLEDLSTGDGVDFYSEPYGWDAGANAGFKNEMDDTNAGAIVFDYTKVYQEINYQNFCPNFKECPGSIKMGGDYLTAVYSGGDCQSFTADVPNLYAQPITSVDGGWSELSNISIVHIQVK